MEAENTGLRHCFEDQLEQEAFSGSGQRLPYSETLRMRELLLRQPYFETSNNAANPILFFNDRRQLLHANKAALGSIGALELDKAVGLRLGEVFGCDHRMSHSGSEPYRCRDCNNMPSLLMALKGRQATETRELILHPETGAKARYAINAFPMSLGDGMIAMLVFSAQ